MTLLQRARAQAQLICELVYVDSCVKLDQEEVERALSDDCMEEGREPPTDAECEEFVCGDADSAEVKRLNALYPRTDAVLNRELT